MVIFLIVGTNPNPCAVNKGGCSHICLLIPGAPWRSCACPLGVRLMSNGLDCILEGIQKVLFVGSTNGLFYISLDTDDFIAQIVRIDASHYENTMNTFSTEHNLAISTGTQQKFFNIDYDPIDGKVYWIDRETQSIKCCRLNGSDYEVYF